MSSNLPPSFLPTLESIQNQQFPDGGFPYQSGDRSRTDSTAWAVLALTVFERATSLCDRGRAFLQSQQQPDGRLCISANQPHASWPTPLAILAWQGSQEFLSAQYKAVDYLLGFTGDHFIKPENSLIGHDPSLRGWPWIANTHSWVLPTSLCMTALQIAGFADHERVMEGQQMLLDRQLPHGGWNSGNTVIFGKELHPLPEATGIALHALAENTPIRAVEKSLDYLLEQWPTLRTPISLGWSMLGLGAWGLKPADAENKVIASLSLQKRYGPYSISSLALLLCGGHASHGLHSLFTSLSKLGNRTFS